jgi:hypothetical protein
VARKPKKITVDTMYEKVVTLNSMELDMDIFKPPRY